MVSVFPAFRSVGAEDFQMTSYEFWKQINTFREEEGEGRIRHGDFLARVRDECPEGVCENFVHPQNKQEYEMIRLDKDQMMLVGMRESKAVRKKVLAWLKFLEQKQALHTGNPIIDALVDTQLQLNAQNQAILKQDVKISEVETKVNNLEHKVESRGCKPGYIIRSDAYRLYHRGLSRKVFDELLVKMEVPSEALLLNRDGIQVSAVQVHEESVQQALESFYDGLVKVSATRYQHPLFGNSKFQA